MAFYGVSCHHHFLGLIGLKKKKKMFWFCKSIKTNPEVYRTMFCSSQVWKAVQVLCIKKISLLEHQTKQSGLFLCLVCKYKALSSLEQAMLITSLDYGHSPFEQ